MWPTRQVALPGDEIHVWLAPVPEHLDSGSTARLIGSLSNEEQARASALRFDKDRTRYVFGCAHVRAVLSMYAAVAPSAWRFSRTASGRPEIATALPGPRLRFSLSRTSDLVACGVVQRCDVGVDLERIDPAIVTSDLIVEACGPAERQALSTMREADVPRWFFEHWTLKEAYAKARGLGLTISFRHIEFDLLADRGSPKAMFSGPLAVDTGAWQFHTLQPSPDHILSVAVRRSEGALRVVVQSP